MITAIIPVYHNEHCLDLSWAINDKFIKEVLAIYDGYKTEWRFNNLIPSALDYRGISIYPDIPWGNARARNIGAINASNDYLLFIDVDHTFKTPFTLKPEPNKVYKFKRVLEKTEWHCNSMLMHRDVFFNVGGYDERFCGHYGYEDRHLEWKLQKAGYEFVNSEQEIHVLNGASVRLDRDKNHNRVLFNKLKQE